MILHKTKEQADIIVTEYFAKEINLHVKMKLNFAIKKSIAQALILQASTINKTANAF